jgi:hypothetical protein
MPGSAAGGETVSVHVDVCGPGLMCLSVQCSLPARLVIQRDALPRMHWCAADAKDRAGFYRGLGHRISYTHAARALLAAEGRARQHLARLEAELADRGWPATITTDEQARLALRVDNPQADQSSAARSAFVVCVPHGNGWVFRWGWGQGIGYAGDIAGAADRIQYGLKAVA